MKPMKNYFFFQIFAFMCTNQLSAMEAPQKKELTVGHYYQLAETKKAVQLLEIITPITYKLARKDFRAEVHTIIALRISAHPLAESLLSKLQQHRNTNSLSLFFDQLPSLIKDTPIYLVKASNDDKEQYVEGSVLKPHVD